MLKRNGARSPVVPTTARTQSQVRDNRQQQQQQQLTASPSAVGARDDVGVALGGLVVWRPERAGGSREAAKEQGKDLRWAGGLPPRFLGLTRSVIEKSVQSRDYKRSFSTAAWSSKMRSGGSWCGGPNEPAALEKQQRSREKTSTKEASEAHPPSPARTTVIV